MRNRITHYITAAYRGTIPLISSCFSGSRRSEEGKASESLLDEDFWSDPQLQQGMNLRLCRTKILSVLCKEPSAGVLRMH